MPRYISKFAIHKIITVGRAKKFDEFKLVHVVLDCTRSKAAAVLLKLVLMVNSKLMEKSA